MFIPASQNKKAVEEKDDGRGTVSSPESDIVPIVSCPYCDNFFFELSDRASFIEHLRTAHSITRNTEALLEFALTLQSG